MQYQFISNGTTKLVLVPETELDRMLLTRIMDAGPVTIDWIRQPVGILGVSVKDGLIIQNQSVLYDSTETKDLSQLSGAEDNLEKLPR